MSGQQAGMHWSDAVHAAMQARGISTVATVPDGGLTQLLDLCHADRAMRVVTLSTEEEGIGIVTGLWAGGRRGMIAMQSSGVGNCINALGMAIAYRSPCLMLVTMRGEWGEFNPWQIAMGRGARPALEAMGATCLHVDDPARVGETFAAGADLAFNGNLPVAVMVGQRVIGAKGFGK